MHPRPRAETLSEALPLPNVLYLHLQSVMLRNMRKYNDCFTVAAGSDLSVLFHPSRRASCRPANPRYLFPIERSRHRSCVEDDHQVMAASSVISCVKYDGSVVHAFGLFVMYTHETYCAIAS